MKKGWKITLIVLASIVGLLLLLLLLAFIVLRIALTPDNLTKIVNNVAESALHCESRFEKVELSLFKTFPNVGLEVKNVCLVNPYTLPDTIPLAQQAQHNDTLARIGSLTIGIDAMAFLRDNQVIVHQLKVDDVLANLYTAPDGWSNYMIFDTSDEEDTTSSDFSLALIDLDKITLDGLTAHYCDLQQLLLAEVQAMDLSVDGQWQASGLEARLKSAIGSARVVMHDSTGVATTVAQLQDTRLALDADGAMDDLGGKVTLCVGDADVSLDGTPYLTATATPHGVMEMALPFRANLDEQQITLQQAGLRLWDYTITLDGTATLAHDDQPMQMDMAFRTDQWNVKELLAALPATITQELKGMNINALLTLDGCATGVVADGQLPAITAHLVLEKGSYYAPQLLPMKVSGIRADMTANLNLSTAEGCQGPSRVDIATLHLNADNSTLTLKGKVDDLLGDMLVDADISGNLNLPDLQAFLPDTMPLALQGTSRVKLHANSRLSALADMDMKKIKAHGNLLFDQLDVRYDSMHVAAPTLDVGLRLPAQVHDANRLIGVTLKGTALDVEMPSEGLVASMAQPDIQVDMPNILDDKQPLAATFDIACTQIGAAMDSMNLHTANVSLKGSIRNDTTQPNVIKQWNPRVEVSLNGVSLALASLDTALQMPSFQFLYQPDVCEISNVDIRIGASDYHLYGRIHDFEDWLSHKEHMRGDLYFNSQYTDVDQLLAMLSGMGTDADTLARQREEDNVPQEANPFIVPKDVNMTLHTAIDHCMAFGNDLQDLKGTITVNNGMAVLDQIGFTCKAARMQLTGVYESPRVNHLFAGLDFHLLDITVEELIDMVPSIDTLVPMLAAFKGKANFHLAAECNLDAFYQPKMSTLVGAAAISGQNLVVMDDKAISNIAKLLQMKDWREKDNTLKVDSLSVEATVFRKDITIYPFLLDLHNYRLCIGGRHNLDNACNYHFELLKCPLPVRLAVDVTGTLDQPNIQLGPVKYAELFKPEKQNAVQARTLALKNIIRQALESNVR